jgi:hypothetical protein
MDTELGTTAADKRSVFVIGFARNASWSGLGGNELHFSNQNSAPGFVDARAEFAFHAFDLLLPGFVIGGNFKTPVFATHRSGVSCKRFTDDTGPGTREPRECRFRAVQPLHDTSQKFASFLHGWAGNSNIRVAGLSQRKFSGEVQRKRMREWATKRATRMRLRPLRLDIAPRLM